MVHAHLLKWPYIHLCVYDQGEIASCLLGQKEAGYSIVGTSLLKEKKKE